MKSEVTKQFAVCLNNNDYPASFEVGKLYRVIEDEQAAAEGYLRVVDESGEDYAFAANRFYLVQLPADVEKALWASGTGTVGLSRYRLQEKELSAEHAKHTEKSSQVLCLLISAFSAPSVEQNSFS